MNGVYPHQFQSLAQWGDPPKGWVSQVERLKTELMSLHNIFWGLSLDGGSLKIGIPQVAVGFSHVSVLKCSSMTWMVEMKTSIFYQTQKSG